MTDYPDAPTVALEPGTTCARCQRPCTDYKMPGPVCILCVTDEHDATIAALTRERDEARADRDKWYEHAQAVDEALMEALGDVSRLRGAVAALASHTDDDKPAPLHHDNVLSSAAVGALAPPVSEARLTLRPEVQQFAEAMERQLRANDHKPGWKRDSARDLYRRLGEESAELLDACLGVDIDQAQVLREAADVANFAMMIADVCGGVRLSPEAGEPFVRTTPCMHCGQSTPGALCDECGGRGPSPTKASQP